jgi:hypothetical protein
LAIASSFHALTQNALFSSLFFDVSAKTMPDNSNTDRRSSHGAILASAFLLKKTERLNDDSKWKEMRNVL